MRTNRIKNKKPPKCGRFLTNHILNPNYLNYSKWCIKSNKKQPAYISWRFHSNCLALPAHTLEEHVHLFQRWYFLDFQVLAVLGGHVFPATKMKESECLARNSTSQIKDGFPVDKLIASFQRPDHCLLKCYSTYLTTQKKLPKKKKREQYSTLHIQKILWMIPVRKDNINYLHTVRKNVLFCRDNLQHL